MSSLTCCVNASRKWYVDNELNTLGETLKSTQKKYRVVLAPININKQKDRSRQQLLVIHHWAGNEFSFVGLSPLGMKLYDGHRASEQLTFNKNPLIDPVDFLLLSQVIIYLEYQAGVETAQGAAHTDEMLVPILVPILEPEPFPDISKLRFNECPQVWCAQFQLDHDELSVSVVSLTNENIQ